MEVADQVGVYLEDGVGNGLPDGGEEGVGLPGGVEVELDKVIGVQGKGGDWS